MLLWGTLVFLLTIAILSAYSFFWYSVLGFRKYFPFHKVIVILATSQLIQSVISALFVTGNYFSFPIQIVSSGTSNAFFFGIRHTTYDPINLINRALVIHIPHHLLIYNILVNLVVILYIYLSVKKQLNLPGKQQLLLWIILIIPQIGIAYLVR